MVVFWPEGESSEFGAGSFAPTGEYRCATLVKDGDSVFVKCDFVAVVTEVADTNKIVREGGHDVAVAVGDGYVTGYGGLVGLAGGDANCDCGC